MRLPFLLSCGLILGSESSLWAQNEAIAELPTDTTAQLTLGLHLQPYFRWSNEKRIPGGLEFYNFDRYNSFSVNSAVIRLDYTSQKVRSSLGLVSGSYAAKNYVQEPAGLQNIYEASVGLKLSKKQDWWLDIGVLPGHLGWESVYGMNNFNLSRSFYSEYTPYYQTGARLSHTSPSGRWSWSVLALNGWQRISVPDSLTEYGLGTTLGWKWNPRWKVHFNTYYGRTRYDYLHYRNNYEDRLDAEFWVQGNIHPNWEFIAGAGAGMVTDGLQQVHLTVQSRWVLNERWMINARLERFGTNYVLWDPSEYAEPSTIGLSMGLDHRINPNLWGRFEYRLNMIEGRPDDVHGLIYSLEFNLDKNLFRSGK